MSIFNNFFCTDEYVRNSLFIMQTDITDVCISFIFLAVNNESIE